MTQHDYPTYTDHQKSWDELAQGIASIRNDVSEIKEGEILPNSKKGELIIIGSGIETVGISVGDQKLLEGADRVLFCVADPATVVWLKRLRPDAIDLYVLYGENKVRYTTYMQMTEAQLYWVRQGQKVVVVFYGHPGVFVLSTHRAIKLARREGYRATMKAGVCALDTLCADLGVDPCHPGLQTHEATDSLVRQRHIDPTLHVILWQVGLIGELGYRRQGYLNNNFSYFISRLETIYSSEYEITHYIGSRYPTIEPLIKTYKLKELHDPENQEEITGLSTFYIPPRDVVPSHYQTVKDLGLISEGQVLVTPDSPLREISLYGPREMKAFDAFENFRIPASYKWQTETAASHFLIELRFDTALQELYLKDPEKALDDPRFKSLSDRERALLVSRDSGAIQVAAKGAYLRSSETEATLKACLSQKSLAADLLQNISGLARQDARQKFKEWLNTNSLEVDWASLSGAIDYIHRNHLFPWTGVYVEPDQELVITIIGNQNNRNRSIVYVNNTRIPRFSFQNGIIKWAASETVPFNGFFRHDVDPRYSKRKIMGKIWGKDEAIPSSNNFSALEVDPDRKELASRAGALYVSNTISDIFGRYAVRTNGRFARDVNSFELSEDTLKINDILVEDFEFSAGKLTWSGGNKECYSGEVSFLCDPIINSLELYGHSFSNEEDGEFKCYGSAIKDSVPLYSGPDIPDWAAAHLSNIVHANSHKGGLLLWHKWEKQNFTSLVVNKYITNLI